MKHSLILSFGLVLSLASAAGQTTAVGANPDILEDLSSLSRNASKFTVSKPMLVETDAFPGFTREMIRVEWRNDDPIYLFVILPAEKCDPKAIRPREATKPPVILYLLSFPTDTDRFFDEEFCKILAKNGFAAVGFVSALTGHRYHDRPMREWFVSELREALVKTAHDVSFVLDYLSTRGDVDMTRVGMFGEGSGGTIAILAASADPRLKAIDLLDPWGAWSDWFAQSPIVPEDERPDFLKAEFLQNLALVDPVNQLPQMKSLQIRYQYVADAAATPQRARDRVQTALPKQARVVGQKDARAAFEASGGADLFDWIKEQVRNSNR